MARCGPSVASSATHHLIGFCRKRLADASCCRLVLLSSFLADRFGFTSRFGSSLMRGHGEATGCFISFDEGVRCACLRHHPSLLRQRDARRLRVALSSWRSFQVIARWSLSVTGAADCCAELFPLFSITAPCRPEMSGASALSGTLLLVSLASGPLTCTTCACGSGVRAGAAVRSGHVVVTLGGECF